MDFDSIVTFLFIIAFFILPSILKQIQARKKKVAKPKKARKTPSIFGRISEQIQQFVQELENQAKQQKKETHEQETIWDTLAEEEEPSFVFESVDEDAGFNEPEPEKIERPVKKKIYSRKPEQESCLKAPLQPVQQPYCFKSNPLQNAIIWSEILSKPLALREK